MYIRKFTHQHSGTEVKLVEELGDKDVVFNKFLGVSFLHILNDVSKPLPLLLATGDPDEENLKKKKISLIHATIITHNAYTFLHSTRAPMLKRWTSSLRIDAKGVTPIPPPTSTETS